eukprot:jgi/Ulvmu1/4487/UM002_0212.1
MRLLRAWVAHLLLAAPLAVHAVADEALPSYPRPPHRPWTFPFHDLQFGDTGSLADATEAIGSESNQCARWMAENSDIISSMSLLNLTLPGSHDSAAYDLNGHIMPGELPWAIRQILLVAESLGLPPEQYIIKWSESQSLKLPEQLRSGIRFLDLRAGYNGSMWVACHTAEGPPVQQLFEAIDDFLNNHEQEVLVVELTHTFNGEDQLSQLASVISQKLGHHIAPCCGLERTMQEFWDDGRRLVFVSSVPCKDTCLWWPPEAIHNSYANTDEMDVMWYYNQDVLDLYRLNTTSLFKLSWTLTPQVTTLLHGLFAYPSTLAELAQQANRLLPDFIDAALAEGRTGFPQILIADEFQDSYLVLLSLRRNQLRPCKYLAHADSSMLHQVDTR